MLKVQNESRMYRFLGRSPCFLVLPERDCIWQSPHSSALEVLQLAWSSTTLAFGRAHGVSACRIRHSAQGYVSRIPTDFELMVRDLWTTCLEYLYGLRVVYERTATSSRLLNDPDETRRSAIDKRIRAEEAVGSTCSPLYVPAVEFGI